MAEERKIKFWVEILVTERMSKWTDEVPPGWDEMTENQRELWADDCLNSLLGNYINIGYELPTD